MPQAQAKNRAHTPIQGKQKSLIRVEAPHFVAGVDLESGVVTHCAPILVYMRGWTRDRVDAYVKRKGWTAEEFFKHSPSKKSSLMVEDRQRDPAKFVE